MLTLSSQQAWSNLHSKDKPSTMPHQNGIDTQFDGEGFLPTIVPKFTFPRECSVFTIGSCFAREIENILINQGYRVAAADFKPNTWSFAKFEDNPWCGRLSDTQLLNEYNVGTMQQRIESALDTFIYPENSGIQALDNGTFLDLFLHPAQTPVTLDQLNIRRKIIEIYYKQILSSDVIVLTLGLIESWYDTQDKVYLNKTPSQSLAQKYPNRYEFHRFTYSDVLSKMQNIINLLLKNGNTFKKILLTVSPIPLEATFTNDNVICATSYSKAILRSVVQDIVEQFENVDYFPSYEIVMSRGVTLAYQEDNIHVKHEVIEKIVNHMVSNFIK